MLTMGDRSVDKGVGVPDRRLKRQQRRSRTLNRPQQKVPTRSIDQRKPMNVWVKPHNQWSHIGKENGQFLRWIHML